MKNRILIKSLGQKINLELTSTENVSGELEDQRLSSVSGAKAESWMPQN